MPKITKSQQPLASLIVSVSPGEIVKTVSPEKQLQQIISAGQQQIKDKSYLPSLHQQLEKQSSISGQKFTKTLQVLLQLIPKQMSSSSGEAQCLSLCPIFLTLIKVTHCQTEVISCLKSTKQIDAVLILCMLWKYYQKQGKQLQSILKILNLLLCSYPVEFVVNGQDVLKKWREVIGVEQQIQKKRIQVQQIVNRNRNAGVHENQSKEKFVDIYIPL